MKICLTVLTDLLLCIFFSTYNLCLDWQRLSSEEISQTLSDDDNIFPQTFYLLEHVFLSQLAYNPV